MLRTTLFLASLLFVAAIAAAAEPSLIVCGGDEVFIVPARVGKLRERDKTWSWRASDSPEIPLARYGQFRTTDECKPYDKLILITSSSSGVALIDRETKKAIFIASARNAHSACLLPEKRIAVASSFGGDELLIFQYAKGDVIDKQGPIARTKLHGAHGAFWDPKQQKLYALGSDELLVCSLKTTAQEGDKSAASVEIVVENSLKLPDGDGHDLSPSADEKTLLITAAETIHQFDLATHEFTPFALLSMAKKVKSIDQHRQSKRYLIHQADLTSDAWWSDTLQLLDPVAKITIEGERLYKARWDQPLESP